MIETKYYNYETYLNIEVKDKRNHPHVNELEDEWLSVTKPISCHMDTKEEEYFQKKDLRVKEDLRHNIILRTLVVAN